MFEAMRFSSSAIRRCCIGSRSGSPISRRASTGVSSTSIVTFIALSLSRRGGWIAPHCRNKSPSTSLSQVNRPEARMSRNFLSAETSPYPPQHADNPVHWRPWGPEALAAAKREKKPILLSVGYAACHWCHVMAHESFEDEGVAAVMNEHFVNVKVDREERPDIDAIYMSALHLLGQQGGWPLTMFLTPEGEPFWGGTYFPKDAAYGRPGFADVLPEVARIFREEPAKVYKNRAALTEALKKQAETARPGEPTPQVPIVVAGKLVEIMDPENGGIRGAPKFPQVPLLSLLWRAHLRTGREDFALPVTRALDHMSEGGIYDHLGGGFARYSVDEFWLAQHFEKMLYDNALLIDLLTLVWAETGKTLYERRGRGTG